MIEETAFDDVRLPHPDEDYNYPYGNPSTYTTCMGRAVRKCLTLHSTLRQLLLEECVHIPQRYVQTHQ